MKPKITLGKKVLIMLLSSILPYFYFIIWEWKFNPLEWETISFLCFIFFALVVYSLAIGRYKGTSNNKFH